MDSNEVTHMFVSTRCVLSSGTNHINVILCVAKDPGVLLPLWHNLEKLALCNVSFLSAWKLISPQGPFYCQCSTIHSSAVELQKVLCGFG